MLVESAATALRRLPSPECSIVLLALGATPGFDSPTAELMRGLKLKGFKIIAYEDGALAWPIGLQCRALLLGASWLLDSSQPDFAEQLRNFLARLLRDEAERSGD